MQESPTNARGESAPGRSPWPACQPRNAIAASRMRSPSVPTSAPPLRRRPRSSTPAACTTRRWKRPNSSSCRPSASRTPTSTSTRERRCSLARAPHDDRWPAILMRMDARRRYAPNGESSARGIDRFFEEMASGAESPALRATARYYVAAGLMRSANGPMLGKEGRDGRRQRALDAATGLSAGVEDQEFGGAGAPPDPSAGAPSGSLRRRAKRPIRKVGSAHVRGSRGGPHPDHPARDRGRHGVGHDGPPYAASRPTCSSTNRV